MYWGENEVDTPTVELYTFNNGLTTGREFIDPATGLDDGIHRVRLTYDWYTKTAVFAFDLDYAGGAFVADLTSPAVSTLHLYGADGWPVEPGKIFFGGDESTTFRDFSVDVTTPALIMGDFNASGTVTTADWAIFRANLHKDLSGLSAAAAYLLGDMNGDGASSHADFVLFKEFFDEANGSGSFNRMIAGVPEPSSFILALIVGLLALGARRRLRG
jgi:hypothetical protein